jgi:ABC-type bacteriocin/lantibiotic exporter with double-glycine peptidase domain
MSVKEIIKKLYKTHWRLLTSIIILSVLSIAVRIASPLFLKNVINYVQTVNTKQLIIWGSIFAVGTIASFIFTSQNNGKIAKFGNLLTQSISKEVFSSYLRSEVLDANKISSDQVVKRILYHTDEIGNKHYSYNLMSFFYQGTLFVSLIITLLIINPWFGLANRCFHSPIYYLISKQVTKILTHCEEKVAESINGFCK